MLQLVNALDSKNPKYLRQLKRLFKQAFPRFERKPWWLLQRTAAARQAELLAVCDSNQPGRFCGLAICLFWQDLVLLDYFAVCPQQRNRGLGRQILPLLLQRYAGRRLLLETERPGSPHTNYADCCRRLRFYAACGLQNTGLAVCLYVSEYLLLWAPCQPLPSQPELTPQAPTFAEYCGLYNALFGELTAWRLNIREINPLENGKEVNYLV